MVTIKDDGIITIKDHDKKDREFDPNNPDDLKKLAEQAEKGYGFEVGQTKLKTVEAERDEANEKVQRWNDFIVSSKENPEQMVEFLEKNDVKIPKSKEKDTEFLENESEKLVSTLESKIDELNKRIDTQEGFLYRQYTDGEHAALEIKYKEGNGYPDYDRKAVEKHSKEKGISNFDAAYWDLNKEKIVEMKEKAAAEKRNIHKKKIDAVATSDTDEGTIVPPKPKVHTKYSDATKDLLKHQKDSGESFFLDE